MQTAPRLIGLRVGIALALGILTLSGCAHKRTTRRIPHRPSNTRSHDAARTVSPLYVETGKASWYGHPYHGRVAANGEIYDMEQLTAAHRTLPFDTWVHVTNLRNDKTVDVRITDRGPFVGDRVIDLSHAAAQQIELIGPGVAEVRLEIMSVPKNAPAGLYAVQVGAFRVKSNAERERARMEAQYGAARLVFREGNPSLWRVLVGAEKTEDAADALRIRIQRDSGERNGFVVRLDS